MIFDNLYKFEKNIAIYSDKNNILKYSDLISYADNYSKKFKERSLAFLISSNTFESIILYIALIRSKCVILIIDDNVNLINFEELFKKYQPNYILCPKNFLKNQRKINLSSIDFFRQYNILENKKKIKHIVNENLMLLLPTSGSLGSPKYVKLSYNNIFENTISISNYLNFDDSHRTITTMPMSYSYGMSIINTHLFNGGSLVLNNKTFFDIKFWKDYLKFKVNNINGVPYHYEILNKLKFSKLFNKNLKYITQAGGALNENLAKRIINLCLEQDTIFYTMYGQTEASPRMSYMKVNNNLNKIGSIGKAIPGGKLWLEKNGKIVKKINTIGELYYKGKNVFMGYSENYKELDKNDEIYGILKTGDTARFDSDNFFYIEGREKRIFKQYGERISLDFIENKLSSHGYECGCLGVNKKIIIFSTIYIDSNIIYKLINILPNRYELRLIKSIPRSKSGKILYNEFKI